MHRQCPTILCFVAAVITAAMPRPMVMMIAMDIGIIPQISTQQRRNRLVRTAADAAVEGNAHVSQRRLCSAADAAADQCGNSVLHQESGQCAVTAAIGVNDFRMSDFTVRSFIKFELFGMAEMLKDLTVFIGNCNFHNGISFAIFVGFFCVSSLHPAAAAAVGCLLSSADAVVSPGDVQRFPVDKTR